MKKTLFLHHIFAAVIACSGILHAQEELMPAAMPKAEEEVKTAQI